MHLLTVQENTNFGADGTMILRLDHSFEIGEDPVYSQPVTLNLDELFSNLYIDSCTEMSLTVNQPVRSLLTSMIANRNENIHLVLAQGCCWSLPAGFDTYFPSLYE